MKTIARSKVVHKPTGEDKTYRVEIVSNAGKVEAVIGEGLSEKRAEQRLMTGLSRIDRNNFFVQAVVEK